MESSPCPSDPDAAQGAPDRLRPDRDRPGLRVRLLGHAGVQGAARRGHRVVLVNSNPATIMTDPEFADAHVRRAAHPRHRRAHPRARAARRACCRRSAARPALNCAIALAESGVLAQARRRADRRAARRDPDGRGPRALQGGDDARSGSTPPQLGLRERPRAGEAGARPRSACRAIIRPRFTLGGSGGTIAETADEFEEKLDVGLAPLAARRGPGRGVGRWAGRSSSSR